jgi:hypothetical protein
MRLALIACLTIVTTMAASGCSSDSENGADGDETCTGRSCNDATDRPDSEEEEPDGDVPSPVGCEENNDCLEGQVCNVDSGRCVSACATDADCGAAAECGNDGLCVARPACDSSAECVGGACNSCLGVCVDAVVGAACNNDSNCGFDDYCDPCLSVCRPRLALCDPCNSDEECGEAGDNCLDYSSGGRFCGQACGTCPVGYQCNGALGQCVALSGSCLSVRECEEPADCPRGETCSATFICVPGCTGDEACPGEQVCSAGACVDPCTDASECPAGAECADGRCVVPGGCVTSRDCVEFQTYCDTNTQQCVPGCEVDLDCGEASLACEGGACVPRGCVGNYSCAFDQVCDAATGQCVEAEGPYCDACNGDDVNSCGNANACVTFQDDDGNDAGAFCLVECVDDPLNACPQGYGCQELDLGDEGVRNVCVRQCQRDPA